MKLLVTGGSGFLGSALLGILAENPAVERIYCLVHRAKLKTDSPKLFPVSGDIRNPDALKLPETPDALVILSGVTNGRGYSAKETMDINYQGLQNALRYCEESGVQNLFYTSSTNVNLKEQGAYAQSKRKAEEAIRNSGLRYMIFRPALLYGHRHKLGLGVIEKSIRATGIVPVFGDGKKLEQPIYVDECAAIMAWYILREPQNRVIELHGKDTFRYNDLCREIGRLIGKKPRLIHIPVKPVELSLKLFEKLGIPLPVSLEQIYHIDSDLCGDMDSIYRETGVTPIHFSEAYLS